MLDSDKIQEAVEKNVKSINQQIKSRGTRVKNALRNAELEVLKGQRSGKMYKKPHYKRRYTASAPGEAPARRTGALRLDWTGGVETSNGNNSTKVTAYIQSDVPYSSYLENGTEKIAPRPFVEKIKKKAKPEIERIMNDNYS